jgi:murein DD-endopeptidase MepM/ murein hydrolase activator NlpD
MQNPIKIGALFVIGVMSLGAMTVLQPRESRSVTTPENAPMLQPVQVAPIEKIETHVIRRGETLSGVLARMAVVGQDLADALFVMREHQDPRRMSDGAEVTVHRWSANGSPRSVELRLNADTTVVLAKNELGWQGNLVLTPVVVDTVFVAGTIDAGTTLYTSLVLDETINLPAAERVQLASELGGIYAYTIDFSREIQPGDSYQIAYEREARPDGTARSRRILISEVVNQGKAISAVFFSRGSIEGYYTKEGLSLRSGFRRSPLEFTRVTSSFNWKRYHPILGLYRAHLGTDYGAGYGTPVYAVADGTVASATRDRGYGNVITLRHFNGYTTRYAHLRGFASGIAGGKKVKQNQIIGYVGSTGLATGPHLHFELRQNGRPVDSRKVKLPGAPPIPPEYRPSFRALVAERLALLDQATSTHLAAASTQGTRAGSGL